MSSVILEFSNRIKYKWITEDRGGERFNFSGSWRLPNLAANRYSAAAQGGAARELILISYIQPLAQKS
jgi:hypothetical protein